MSNEIRDRLSGAGKYSRLRDENFSGADLASVHIVDSSFQRCTFDGADLRQATLDGCFFKLCTFVGTNFHGASLRKVSFTGCDLSEADLGDCDLSFARFDSFPNSPDAPPTKMTRAELQGAVLNETVFDRVVDEPST